MLSPVKYQERLKNLSAIAAKVYAAVPASEPWSMSYINSELQRTGGITRDTRLLHGCLNSLKLAGLISEPERGVFIRVPVRSDKPKTQSERTQQPTTTEDNKMPAPAPAAKTPRNPLTILNELAAKCKTLQDEIELAALEIDEYVTAKDGDAAKLKQLQALLKSLS